MASGGHGESAEGWERTEGLSVHLGTFRVNEERLRSRLVELTDIRAEYESIIGPDPLGPEGPSVVDAMNRALEVARITHPDYRVDAGAFARHLATIVGTGAGALEGLVSIEPGNVFLTFACAAGDARAVADFDRLLEQVAAPAIAKLGLDSARVDEVLQRVRVRLILGEGGAGPKVLSYEGVGSLEGWLAIVARNAARTLLGERGERPWAEVVDDLAEAASHDDAEFQYLARAHADTLRASTRAALERLEPQERAVLRFKLVENLSIDQIGAIGGFDRATAARRILRAKAKLRELVAAEFCERSGTTPSEYRSILRALSSVLQVSIEQLLVDNPAEALGRR